MPSRQAAMEASGGQTMIQVTEQHGSPPIKHPLALGAAASRFCVPQENGQEKGEQFMSYLYVKWNSFGLRFARRRFAFTSDLPCGR